MSQVFPTLVYRDADAAIDFLKAAFGVQEHSVHRDDAGQVSHAELRVEDGLVMVGQEQQGARFSMRSGGSGVYVARDEVDEHFARARAAGAEIVMEPTDQPYGSRDYIARDPEGNFWSFGTYRPG